MAAGVRVSARQAAKPTVVEAQPTNIGKKRVPAAKAATSVDQGEVNEAPAVEQVASKKPKRGGKPVEKALKTEDNHVNEDAATEKSGKRQSRQHSEPAVVENPAEAPPKSRARGKVTKAKTDTATPAEPLSKTTKKRSKPSDGDADNDDDAAAQPESTPPPKKRARKSAQTKAVKEEGPDSAAQTPASKEKKPRKPKANPYGFTPGETPFPDHPAPTAEQCQTVVDLLSTIHGNIQAPKEIPAPSLTVSGCGEVPSILDALIRTLLSAATTGRNSSNAFQGLVKTFGLIDKGVGKGSVNWNKVRLATQPEVFEAIKCGGLAANKSKNIKALLDQVYEDIQARAAALVKAEEDTAVHGLKGIKNQSEGDQNAEIYRAEHDILSLDHLHALSRDEAMVEMMKFPGVGMKTSSCVALFCMQRPSFAVDTHVWRMCKWLGWVPERASRDETYRHCEVRVPDEQKYALHQLFIKHGKTCPRCRAITGENSEGWEKGCVIDHLVTRTGPRKGPLTPKQTPKKGASARSKGKKEDDTDMEEDADEEMPDLGSDGESDFGTKNKSTPQNKKAASRKRKAKKEEPVSEGEDEDEKKVELKSESGSDGGSDEKVPPRSKRAAVPKSKTVAQKKGMVAPKTTAALRTKAKAPQRKAAVPTNEPAPKEKVTRRTRGKTGTKKEAGDVGGGDVAEPEVIGDGEPSSNDTVNGKDEEENPDELMHGMRVT